jgi:hypothetical protein
LLGSVHKRPREEEAVDADQGGHRSAPGELVFDQVNSACPATVTLGAAQVTFSVTARVAGGTWTYSSTVAMLQAWTASWPCTGTRCFALPG